MATECDVSKPRHFNRDMSRRTRRSASLITCYQDRYRPLIVHLPQDAKTLFHCQDTDQLEAIPQCEVEEQGCEDPKLEVRPAPPECEVIVELKVPEQFQDAQVKKPVQYPGEEQEENLQEYQEQDEEQKTAKQHHDEKTASEQYQDDKTAPEQYQDEEQMAPEQYQDEEQMAPEQYQDEGKKTPDQYQEEEQQTPQQEQDEDKKVPEQYQDEEQKIPEQDEEQKDPVLYQDDDDEKTPILCQDDEQKTPILDQDDEQKTPPVLDQDDDEKKTGKQCQEEDDEKASAQHQDGEQKAQHERQHKAFIKKLITQASSVNDVPRSSFSLQELIQGKQLVAGEAKVHSDFISSQGKSDTSDHTAAATGGTTLAMVIRRPEAGKKPAGIIRRCVKALNQMIKTKHGSKKSPHFKEV